MTAISSNHTSTLGVLSGFSGAVLLIFLGLSGRGRSGRDDTSDASRFHTVFGPTVMMFLCAFLHCLLGSLLYSIVAGAPGNEGSDSTWYAVNHLFNLAGTEYALGALTLFSGIVLAIATRNLPRETLYLAFSLLGMVFLVTNSWMCISFTHMQISPTSKAVAPGPMALYLALLMLFVGACVGIMLPGHGAARVCQYYAIGSIMLGIYVFWRFINIVAQFDVVQEQYSSLCRAPAYDVYGIRAAFAMLSGMLIWSLWWLWRSLTSGDSRVR